MTNEDGGRPAFRGKLFSTGTGALPTVTEPCVAAVAPKSDDEGDNRFPAKSCLVWIADEGGPSSRFAFVDSCLEEPTNPPRQRHQHILRMKVIEVSVEISLVGVDAKCS